MPSRVSNGIRLGEDGAWFQRQDGERVDLSRRPVLRNVLRVLADARQRTPGTPVSAFRLIHDAWPGDRARHESALNRLYVALSTLRELGLRDVIVRHNGGYLIAPARGRRIARD
jgi:hypothetical protein